MASPTHEEIENEGNGLASNVLGLFESSIMGIAGSAPAYSIAATTVTLQLPLASLAQASFSTLELRCSA